MGAGLEGQVALMTGPATGLSAAVARRLTREGVRIVFAGPIESDDGICRRCALDADLSDAEAVQALVAAVERAFGRIDALIHTLGGQAAGVERFSEMWGGSARRSHPAPLAAALTCTRGALRHMSLRGHGHVVHLVTRADVGAMEVERLALARLRQAWEQDGIPVNVAVSTIYFAETAALPSGEETVGESRLLERFTGRLVEEDDWAARVFLEEQIGDVVAQVCAHAQGAAPGTVRAFECPGRNRLMSPHPMVA